MISRLDSVGGSVRYAGADVKYIPPFDVIKRSLNLTTTRGELRVSISYADLVDLLRGILTAIEVDEAWYLETYPDIGQAVENGSVPSATQHFAYDGFFEGRLPFAIDVEEKWYLRRHPDVAESIRLGSVTSAQRHFEENGYREGRLPRPLGD